MKYSIITICFNNINGLKKTIASLEKQTCDDYEFIIIDGGSTDGTKALLENLKIEFENKKITMQYISEKDNGIYDAMNKGIKLATGDYLNFMNAGDCFYDNKVLEKVKNYLNSDIVYGDCYLTNNHNEIKLADKYDLNYIEERMCFCHQAAFIKKELFDNNLYNLNYKFAADYCFFLGAHLNNKTFSYAPINVCMFEEGGASYKYRYEIAKEYYHIKDFYGLLKYKSIKVFFKLLKTRIYLFMKK